MSRDDSGSFLPHYAELEILPVNPFASIDQTGVGKLMETADRPRPQDPPRHQVGHLRRARWRAGEREVLPPPRVGLRVVQPLPRTHRAAGGGAGGAGERNNDPGLTGIRGAAAAFEWPPLLFALCRVGAPR